tara:strand:+ start:66 stop:740 length:675 start_codon:yes stop_codon:yes gene_type:complete
MEEVQNIIEPVVNASEKVLNRALDNVYISTAIKVFIGLYAAFAAPKLPPTLVNLMDNTLVRIIFAFVIVLTATRDPSIAILIAIAFIITLQTANKYRLINTSLSVAEPGESSWLPSAKDEVPQEDESQEDVQEQQDMHDMHVMEQSMPSNNLNEDIIEPMASEPATEQPTNSFTSEYQFLDASSNAVPGANQESSVSTFDNQLSVQGLHDNVPDGLSGPEYHSL